MTEPLKSGGQPLNRNPVTHGLRSARVSRSRRNRLHPELRKALLSTWPKLGAFPLEVGIGLFADHRGLRGYIDQHDIISSRGLVLKAAEEMDRLRGRIEAWMKRADETGGGKADPGTFADLLGDLQ
jgi:hypothetical protein